MKTLADEGDRRAKRVVKIVDNFDKALITLLIMINVIYVTASSVATVFAMDIFDGLPFFGKYASVIATVIMTLMVFIFCETIPKTIAKTNSDTIAMYISLPVFILMKIMTPISVIFSSFGNLIKKILKRGDKTPTMTEDEFSTIIDNIEEEGVIEPEEKEIIKSAITFSDLFASDVMTKREDIESLNLNLPQKERDSFMINAKYSRLPIYRHDLDHIYGIVQTSDYLWRMMNNSSVDLPAIVKKAYFINPSMKLDLLFEEMEKHRTHIAVVAENGRTLGIVTMEDILEELVGEIYDEDDIEAPADFQKSADKGVQIS